MRQGRLKAPADHPVAYYHCISRVVDRQRVFGEREKDQFVDLMREYESFCGVQVVTFSVMSNHFHILLEVPRRPAILPTDDQLLERIERLTGWGGRGNARQMLEQLRRQGHHEAAEAFRQKFFARMWDVSGFMKLLKQRFTQWFNREHGRKGTLWEERFKSVLVEGAGQALATMAAYIDLNGVRAKVAEDPKDYRWCGYAQAMAGGRRAQEGLRIAAAGGHRVAVDSLSLEEALMKYRVWLFGQGAQDEGTDEQGRPLRAGIALERVAAVMAGRGRVSPAEYVRMPVRYFTDGAVLGTRAFVDGVFQSLRNRFGPKRKDGARRMRGVASTELYALRDLRLRLLG